MGAALIASSIGSYVRSRRDAEGVSRLAGRQIARVVTRELVRSPGDSESTLDWAVSEMRDEGLRYAALCRPREGCGAEAGTRLAPLPAPPYVAAPWERGRGLEALRPHPVAGGERMRMLVPLRPSGAPGRRGPGFRGRPSRDLVTPDGPPPRVLLLEYEPLAARRIRSRAAATLTIGLGSAALLLVVTGIVWRLGVRAERYERQLARDRELKKLGEISAVLGHQLRNPLASLKGHAQLLLEGFPSGSSGREGAETVVREASRLEVLTDQILDFVRTGSVERRPVDPGALLRGIGERWPEGRVVVEASGAPDPWPLDRDRFEQALVNIVDNAVDASPPGTPVRLEAHQSSGKLSVRVVDQGPGLQPGEEERIFEPFYTQRVHGTGLGLALARRIVEGHGGSISARRVPEGGTEIRIELPEAAGET
jgi:two-component system sensor histidine kinase HydH